MAAPSPSTVVIACPNCGTRYQLARDALGKKRMVKCAHCQTAWEAFPADLPPPPPPAPPEPAAPEVEDRLFDPAEEKKLDADFEAAERAEAEASPKPASDIVASIAPKPKPKPAPDAAALSRKLQRAFLERQARVRRQLPISRVRSAARQVGLAALIVVLVVMLVFRTSIVRQFPDLAGAYEALGLGVNVVGLAFEDVRTLKSLRDGAEVLIVDARISSVADETVVVPRVVVTLLDGDGRSIYEWSLTPQVRELEPGEGVDIETQLVRPPGGAQGVRLTFAQGSEHADSTIASSQPGEPAG